jgi:hypothetical protein
MLMEVEGAVAVAELSGAARLAVSAVNLGVDTAINAGGQVAIQGGSLPQAFVENLFMSVASTALFGAVSRAAAESAALEGRQAMTWAKANAAGKALMIGKEVGAITVHTVWGAAIGDVSRRIVTGNAHPSPMEARDWALQGAAAAIGRGVHKSLGDRVPGLERLAKRQHSEQLYAALTEAHRLQQLAAALERSRDPAAAAALLSERTRFLHDELAAIEQLIAAHGDTNGELSSMREEISGQLGESRRQAMLETQLHLIGLHELIPGALWKGTHEQIQTVIEQAKQRGSTVLQERDAATGHTKLTIDGHSLEFEQISVGGVRGAGVYPPKEFVKEGATRKSKLNQEKVKDAIKKVAARPHLHGALLEVALREVTADTATGTLRIPGHEGAPGGAAPLHAAVEVALELHFKSELTESSAHGEEAGPARYTLDKSSSGGWVARVEIDQHLEPRDVEFVISHELDEISEIVRRHPAGKPAAGFDHEMTAGVMRAGATTGDATAHDVANAREIVALQKDYDKLVATSSPNAASRKQMLERAIAAAGLHEPSQIDAKVRLLREAGAPEELLRRVQGVEAQRIQKDHMKSAESSNSALTLSLVDHILWPRERSTGDFINNGMNGGHHTARLLAMAWPNGPYVFVEVASKAAAGSVARRFAQYKWADAGPMPTPGSGHFPTDKNFDLTGWARSKMPKTTFDDPMALLREGEEAWQNWLRDGAIPTGKANEFSAVTASGVEITGFFDTEGHSKVPNSLFVEASWF